MLQKIYLKNFQSHKDTTITLAKGLNAIVGTSDSGKSAIMRALRWVVYNRPVQHISTYKYDEADKKEIMSAAMEFDDVTVTRFKKGTVNGYTLSNVAEPLAAIKTTVPKEVSDALQLSDVNMQSQHKAYFLLTEKGSKKAAKFNEIANLASMDMCVSEVK